MVPSAVSSRVFSTPPGSLADVELCVAAWRLKLTEQFDELLCLPHLRGVQRLDYKDQAIEAFREHARVLLATEVGGEGRNLQFANVLINFDLPWNPMKIEQRIGRLHRIGQQLEVHLFSLCNAHSAEERILDVLDRRIHLFELVVGEVDLILGRALGEKEFDERVFDIYASTQDEPALQKEFEALAEELSRARRGYEQVKALDEQLFAEDFET